MIFSFIQISVTHQLECKLKRFKSIFTWDTALQFMVLVTLSISQNVTSLCAQIMWMCVIQIIFQSLMALTDRKSHISHWRDVILTLLLAQGFVSLCEVEEAGFVSPDHSEDIPILFRLTVRVTSDFCSTGAERQTRIFDFIITFLRLT